MQELTNLVQSLNQEIESYNTKPTKAASKRIRLLLGQLKKETPRLRAQLIELDKAS